MATIFFGGGIYWLFNPFTQKAEAAWFNDNWGYRKAVTLTVTSSSSDITNLQTRLTVDTTGITAKLQTNCEDLRFVSATSGNILPYYNESCSDNSATNKIWVMADFVPKNTTTYTMYMYYGNPTSPAGSNSSPWFDNVVNLIGYWTMNESSWNGTSGEVKDSSFNANNATGVNSVSTTTGKYSNAGSFTAASSHYVNAGTPASLDTILTGSYTIEGWVNITSGTDFTFIGRGDSTAAQQNKFIAVGLSGGKVYHQVRGNNGEGSTATIIGSTSLTTGGSTWYHFAAVRDRTANKVRVYLNGVSDATEVSDNAGSITFSATRSLCFGAGGCNFSVGGYLNGKLDDIKIYTGVRTAAQILNDANNVLPNNQQLNIASNATGISGPSTSFATEEKAPSPVVYWKFDDGTGTTANDFTANNLDGTLNNTPIWQTEDLCISGKCLYFDGSSNESVSKSDDALLDFVAADNFTVQAWVKRNGAASANTVILNKSTANIGSTYTGYKLYMDDSGDLCFAIQDGTNAVDSACTSAVDFDDNQWHFVTGVKAATTSVTLYVDGVSRASDSSIASTGTLANSSTLYAGIDSDGTSNDWLGFIDEVKVFRDNTARTAAQVKAEYNSRSDPEGVALSSSTLPNNQPGALNNGLVGYWKMNESSGNATDSSGNSNTGTNNNTTTYANGKFGNAASLASASSQYFSVTDATSLNPSTGITVSAWVNYTTIGAASTGIMCKAETPAQTGWCLGTLSTGSKLRFYPSGVQGTYSETSSTISTSTWYHVVATYDGSNIRIYLNGVLEDTDALSGSVGSNSQPLTIGRWYGNHNDYYLNGKIDEARMYNRALSPTEVSQLYNFAPGPVGYWKMDEGAGTTTSDSSGNGNTSSAFTGNVAWTTGKYGKALNFDGANDVVRIVESTSTDLGATGTLTVGAWIKTSTNMSGGGSVISKYAGTAPMPFDLYVNSSNFGCFELYDGTNNPNTCGSTSLIDGKWHYLTGIRDTTADKIYIYVDGVLINSTTDTTTGSLANDADVSIGNSGTSYTNNDFNGTIDDAKLYNYARTPSQIVSDMNAGHPSVGSPISSPIGYWKFDEGALNTCSGGTNDACNSGSQGTNLDGTFNGDATYTQAGKFGKSLSLDGTGDYVDVGSNSALNFGSGDFTYSAWIKTSASGGSPRIIAQDNNGSALRSISLNASDFARFACRDGSDNAISVDGTTAVNDGNWHHIAGVRIGTTGYIYVDGKLQASTTNASIGSCDGGVATNIGRRVGAGGSLYFNGQIDEAKIYNYGLTAEQVKLDMNRQSAQVLGAAGTNSSYQVNAANQEYCVPGDSTSCAAPIVEYKFEEGAGNSIFDTSGNNYTQTWSGAGTRYVPGKFGKAGNFVSATPIYANASSGVSTSGAKSFGTWFKTTATTQQVLFDNNGVDSSRTGIYMTVNTSAGKLTASSRRASAGTSNFVITSSATINDGKWHYGFVTWDGTTGSNGVKLYVDGVLDTQGTAGNASDDTPGRNLYIGIAADGVSIPFDGQIDQLRIYNYTRTSAQVAWDYNKGAPIAHWKLDECQGSVANDSSGNSQSGTITIGATGSNTSLGTCSSGTSTEAWNNGTTGKKNYSLNFDGTDDLATITNSSTMQKMATQGTISFWIKTDTTEDEDDIATDVAGTGSSGLVVSMSTSNKIKLQYGNGTNTTSVTSTSSLTAGTWFFVTATWSSSGGKIYINGIQEATSATAPSISIAQTNTTFARFSASAIRYFDGSLDDVKFFNYQLTDTQIKSLMNEGVSRSGPVTGAP